MIMVYTNYDGSDTLMLHTKFDSIGPQVPEKNILRVKPYMGMAANLVM